MKERRDALRVRGLVLHSFQNGIVGVRVPGNIALDRANDVEALLVVCVRAVAEI